MTIKINDKDITLQLTLRCFIVYERLFNESVKYTTMTEIVKLFYAVVVANSNEFRYTLDEFIDWLDDKEDLIYEFLQFIINQEMFMKQFHKKTDNQQGSELSFSEIMTIVCLEYKCVTVEYFLDKMQMYELETIMENINSSIKNEWEQCRRIVFGIERTHFKGIHKPSDVIKFPWDIDDTKKQISKPQKQNINITKEYVEKMKAEALKHREEYIKQGLIEG